jgi:DNA topoisomerase-2
MTNMHAFDPFGRIVKIESPEELLASFFRFRLPFYAAFRDMHIRTLTYDLTILQNKQRFVQQIIQGELPLFQKSDQEILTGLTDRGYFADTEEAIQWHHDPALPPKEVLQKCWEGDLDRGEYLEGRTHEYTSEARLEDYKYLLKMQAWSFSQNKIDELGKEIPRKVKELEQVRMATPIDLWRQDLSQLEIEWNKF